MKKTPSGRHVLLERPAQIRALRSPLRLHLVATLRALGEASVRDLAEHLGRSPESLHYHVRALVRAGLVARAGKRPTGPRMETVYRLAGRDLRVDHANRERAYLAALSRMYAACLREAGRSLDRSLREQVGTPAGSAPPVGTWQVALRLPRGEARRLMRRIRAFVDEALARSGTDGAGELYQLTLAFAPDAKADRTR